MRGWLRRLRARFSTPPPPERRGHPAPYELIGSEGTRVIFNDPADSDFGGWT